MQYHKLFHELVLRFGHDALHSLCSYSESSVAHRQCDVEDEVSDSGQGALKIILLSTARCAVLSNLSLGALRCSIIPMYLNSLFRRYERSFLWQPIISTTPSHMHFGTTPCRR